MFPLSPPPNFRVTVSESSHVRLNWSDYPPTEKQYRRILGYRLYRSVNKNELGQRIADERMLGPSVFQYDDSSPDAGPTRYYTLVAVEDTGYGTGALATLGIGIAGNRKYLGDLLRLEEVNVETVKAVLDKIKGASQSDFIRNVIRDMKSTRSLWCWVYLALYVFVCVWALRNRPQAAQAVVTVTGGLASSIFAGYVFSKSFEKRHKIGAYAPPDGPPEPGRGETPS